MGLKAGLTILEPALILPGFLPDLPLLPSPDLADPPGVVALAGDLSADMDGLDVADPGRCRPEFAVLNGPSFGVFRAVILGVASAEEIGVISGWD